MRAEIGWVADCCALMGDHGMSQPAHLAGVFPMIIVREGMPNKGGHKKGRQERNLEFFI